MLILGFISLFGGLTGQWPLDDGGSSVRDSSPSRLSGTAVSLWSSVPSRAMLTEILLECVLWIAELLLDGLCELACRDGTRDGNRM